MNKSLSNGLSFQRVRIFSFLVLILILALLLLSGFKVNAFPTDANSNSAEVKKREHPDIPVKTYFGQKPPGMNAEHFGSELISKDYRDRGVSFTPNLQEMYFYRRISDRNWTLMSIKVENGIWVESEVMPRIGRPGLAPGGNTMMLGSKFMERTAAGWGEVQSFGPEFEQYRVMRSSMSSKGTIIFDEVGPRDGSGKLRYSRLVNGKYETPKTFGKQVNTGLFNAHPFIAPDESFLIFDGERESGFGGVDLYISFKQDDGSWGTAINMGDKVNSSSREAGGYVSPDGKFFFFSSSRVEEHGGVFWMDAKIIEELRATQSTE